MEALPRMVEHQLFTVTDQDMPLLGVVDLGVGPGADADLVSAAVVVSASVVVAGVGAGKVCQQGK